MQQDTLWVTWVTLHSHRVRMTHSSRQLLPSQLLHPLNRISLLVSTLVEEYRLLNQIVLNSILPPCILPGDLWLQSGKLLQPSTLAPSHIWDYQLAVPMCLFAISPGGMFICWTAVESLPHLCGPFPDSPTRDRSFLAGVSHHTIMRPPGYYLSTNQCPAQYKRSESLCLLLIRKCAHFIRINIKYTSKLLKSNSN